VPLSEHEQRLLDQIERALYAEDPKFATSVRARDLRSHYRLRMARSAVAFVAGLVLLFSGVISRVVPLGVLGFVVMLGALLFGLTSWQRLTGHRDVSPSRRRSETTPRADRPSLMNRLEERWRRRWEEHGR
jgi:fatty acid desaturase